MRRQAGITLMELMVVVAIIAIIAAVAYPSYNQYVVRAKRATAATYLLQVADRQQNYFMENKRFASNMTELGYPSNSIAISDDSAVVGASDKKRIYAVSLTDTSATTYRAIAEPQLGQSTRDTDCGTISIDQAGGRDQSGAGENCW